ncbi:hypothetical protein QL285_068815 [Trifolium repens]|nr:hypothetical protein QL285_068815 [Trifolium repens]
MTAQPSAIIVQEPFDPELVPVIDLTSQASFVDRPSSTDCGRDAMEFLTEKFVDFESLRLNGIDVQSLFYDQQWGNYFDMLNGFVYYDIVKNFWHKAYVFDEFSANEEVNKLVAKDKNLKGKSRVQLGLRAYKGKEIRSNLLDIDVLITQEHVAKILGLDNKGQDVNTYKSKSMYTESIKADLFPVGTTEKQFGNAKYLKPEFNFAFRVFLASIIPRIGGKDTISLPHRHFLWFLHKRVKVNLASLLFEHLCSSINENQHKAVATLHHPRLISEIIRQTKLIEILREKEKLRVFQTAKFDATILVNMKKKKKEELIHAENLLKTIYETYFWCDGFPTISEHDNEEVIKNFLAMVRRETGVRVTRSMVVNVPDWDIFKGPKEITRSRKKPRLVEQALLEDSEKSNSEGQEEQSEDNSATEDDERVTEEQVAKIVQRKAVEKERRSKKRNERPAAAEEDQPVRATKRIKTVVAKKKAAGTSKGNISKPNADSTSEAQPLNPSPIDYTKPLNVIPPSPQPLSSSSSSSEETFSDTSTDSSELLIRLDKFQKEKSKKKIHVKRTPMKKTLKKTKTKPQEENIVIDTSILDQPTNTTRKSPTILDYLSTHLSGDAFTHSNLESPNHPINKFVNTTSEPPITIVQTPPPIFAASEQDNPPTFTPVQDEVVTHSEHHTASPKPSEQSPHHSPEHTTVEPAQNTTEQQPHTTSETTPAEIQNVQTPPSTPLIHGPSYKPLTVEEVILTVDFALPILEDYLKKQIDIDDEPISLSLSPNQNIDLSKIRIIPLKRKRPTIPFNKDHPFFNPISEPNLELIDIAISISLKRLKSMEKETLVFPSDVDAEIRDMESKFSETLRLLGNHVKERIKGKGMDAISHIMASANCSQAPRLTFYNHEAELKRLKLLAAIQESTRMSSEAAERLVDEEARYARLVIDAEQARIAEIEHKRLADQEALRLVVDVAVHIAEVETNKIKENQASEEDFVMHDQNRSEPDSDKGKAAIIDSSPPRSPPRLVQGSSSSAIPSAIQLALDEIKSDLREELRNEMDEFRADIREDMNKSGEATNKKIDAMMELLLKLTQQQPKP